VTLIQYAESLNVQLQTSSWIRVTECTVTNFILNQSHWMYSYKLHSESEALNVQLQTSSWISHWMYSYKLHPESESLNVQLQTSYWIRVTECTVTHFILNQSHWMSVTLIQYEVCNCTFSDWFSMKFVTVHSVTLIQYEVCNCTFSDSDSVLSL
jgi:hypothetical protein